MSPYHPPVRLKLRAALVAAAVLSACVGSSVLAQGGGLARPAISTESGPRWQELTASQRSALKPLERDWSGIDASRKQKWLEVANRYPGMPKSEQERISARMAEWVRLSPSQRGQARLNFQNSREITPAERQARWQAYQSLSPEARSQLAERAAPGAAPRRNGATPRDGIQSKSNIVPNPTLTASRRPVSPSVVQAAPGATTSLISKRPTPPTHQQPGLPKIAATPNFVDKQTLLPQRGAQGAAGVPPAPTRSR